MANLLRFAMLNQGRVASGKCGESCSRTGVPKGLV
jgi:hypothetical protein